MADPGAQPPRQGPHQHHQSPVPHHPNHHYQAQPQPQTQPQPQYSTAVKPGVLAYHHNPARQASATPPALQATANSQMQASSQAQHQPQTQPNGSGTGTLPTQQFRSPTLRGVQPAGDAQFEAELAALKTLMDKCRPAVVRQAVRDMYEKTLSGSEYQSQFVVHSAFHNASPMTFGKAAQEVGGVLIRDCIAEVGSHIGTRELDIIAPQIFPRASTAFLDQALAIRLESISGRQLVNALAKAERLGYNVEDILAEPSGTSMPERVIPAMNAVSSNMLASQPPPPRLSAGSSPAPVQLTPTPLPVPPERISQLGIQFCTTCGRPCSGERAMIAHAKGAACQHSNVDHARFYRDVCIHCGQLFTSNGGLAYHVRSNVCGEYSPEVRSVVAALLKTAPQVPSHAPINNVQPHRTPGNLARAAEGKSSPSPAPIPKAGSPKRESPYAKLTPEQRRNFEAEMRRAEDHYGKLMAAAMKNENQEEANAELTRLKNRYNTKQSLTRKKYGIRLRERRTRAEVEEERERLMAKGDAASKRARTDGGTITISDIGGGLPGSAGTAETRDTTIVQPQLQHHVPHPQTSQSAHRSLQQTPAAPGPPIGTAGDPMQIGESSSEESSGTDDTTEDQ